MAAFEAAFEIQVGARARYPRSIMGGLGVAYVQHGWVPTGPQVPKTSKGSESREPEKVNPLAQA